MDLTCPEEHATEFVKILITRLRSRPTTLSKFSALFLKKKERKVTLRGSVGSKPSVSVCNLGNGGGGGQKWPKNVMCVMDSP